MGYKEFKKFVEDIHVLQNIPFTLCYTSGAGDLLPITNDEVIYLYNFLKYCL